MTQDLRWRTRPRMRAWTSLGDPPQSTVSGYGHGRPGRVGAAAPRRAPDRPARSSRPPRPRPRSRRSCPSTARARVRRSARAAASDSSRSPRKVGPASSGSVDEAPDGHEPADSRSGSASERRAAPRRRQPAAKPALAGSASTLTWTQDRIAGRRAGPRGPGDRGARRARPSRPTGSTSNSSSARRALFDWSGPTRCQRDAGHLGALAAASWTRFSPRVVVRPRRRPAAARRHGLGRRRRASRPPGRDPRGGTASAIRARTRARAWREGARAWDRRPAGGSAGPARLTSGAGSSGSPGRRRRRRGAASAAPARRPIARRRGQRWRPGAAAARRLPVDRSVADLGRAGAPAPRGSRARAARRPETDAVHRRRSPRGALRWRLRAAVEAGRDDRDHHLVAEPLVEARAEDDVRLRVGGLA